MTWCSSLKIMDKKSAVFLGVILGVVSYLAVYGIRPLNVLDDTWIMLGYDEMDILARYAGWVNYKDEQWNVPLGQIYTLAYPCGMVISYLDALPWVSVVFKIFAPILPETFQFEGVYMLLVFALQGLAAALLIYRKCKDCLKVTVGSLFFIFSPILLERGFRHSSLASHFLILFSIYLWLECREQLRKEGWFRVKYLIGFVILNFVSVGITPYFMPMVMCFLFLSVTDYFRYTKKLFNGGFILVLNCMAVLVSGYLLGTLGSGVNASRWGYGHFSMNINAFMNPKSLGGYEWSKILKEQEQMYGQYDGFNYFGLGIMLLLLLYILFEIYRPWRELVQELRKEFKNNWLLILTCIFLTAFAVSNVICFGTSEIHLPLPESILELCGIFRASSRLFWPVYYLVILALVNWCIDKAGVKILLIACFIQIFDMGGMVIQKNNYFKEAGINYEFPDFYEVMGEDKELICVAGNGTVSAWYFGVMCGKKHMRTNLVYASSGDYSQAFTYGERYSELLDSGTCSANKIFMTNDSSQFQNWKKIYDKSECSFYECESGGILYYFLVSGNRDIERLTCVNLTDSYWYKGVSEESQVLLFKYSQQLIERLEEAVFVETDQRVKAEILDITNDGVWIHVRIDGNKEAFTFPHVISLQEG